MSLELESCWSVIWIGSSIEIIYTSVEVTGIARLINELKSKNSDTKVIDNNGVGQKIIQWRNISFCNLSLIIVTICLISRMLRCLSPSDWQGIIKRSLPMFVTAKETSWAQNQSQVQNWVFLHYSANLQCNLCSYYLVHQQQLP